MAGREVNPITALLTDKAYGHPTRGVRRRRTRTVVVCLHQTVNAKETAMQAAAARTRPTPMAGRRRPNAIPIEGRDEWRVAAGLPA
jgi:hypothetical protein